MTISAGGSPPVLVCKIVPASPTAHPVFESMKKTERRARFDPVTCCRQVAPPSVVRKMVLILGLHAP